MSQFAILDADYRLIETQFGDELVVFKATCVGDGQTVGIRTPGERMLGDPSAVHQFSEAAARLAALSGPAVVNCHFIPAGRYDQRPYLVTDWPDSTFADVLGEGSPTPSEVEFRLQKLAALLGQLSERGIAHGSLQPADIYCGESVTAPYVIGALPALRPRLDPQGLLYSPPIKIAEEFAADAYAVGAMAARVILTQPDFERLFERREVLNVEAGAEALGEHVSDALSHAVSQLLDTRTTTSFAAANTKAAAVRRALSDAQAQPQVAAEDSPIVFIDERQGPLVGHIGELANEIVVAPMSPAASRSASPANASLFVKPLLIVGLLLAVGAGVWYGWKHFHTRSELNLAFAELAQAEAEARLAGAVEHALDEWAQARSERESARVANQKGHAATAMHHASEAARVFTYAVTIARQRRAEHARARARQTLQGVNLTTAEGLDGYAAMTEIRDAAARSFDAGDFEQAEQIYRQLNGALEDLGRHVRAIDQRHAVESKLASIASQGMAVEGGQFAAANALLAAANTAYTEGRYEAAADRYAETGEALDGKFAELSAKQNQRLRSEAEQARRTAESEGGAELNQFRAADRLLAEAIAAIGNEDLASVSARFHEVTQAFLQVGVEVRAARAGDAARNALAQLRDSGATTRNLTELFDNATLLASRGAFIEAAAVYESVVQQAVVRMKDAAAAEIDTLVAQARRQHSTQRLSEASNSEHFKLALDALETGESLRKSGELQAAKSSVELALREFESAVKHGSALTSLERAEAAERGLGRSSIALDTSAIDVARDFLQTGRKSLNAKQYERANGELQSATDAFDNVMRSAYLSEFDSLEQRIAILQRNRDAQTVSAHATMAGESLRNARVSLSSGGYEAAMQHFQHAVGDYTKAVNETRALELEATLRGLLARLVEDGVDTSDEQLSAAQEQVLGAQKLYAEESYVEAGQAYDTAIRLAESALARLARTQAAHARDVAEAVKMSADSSGAAQADSYADAAALHARANQAFVLGDFEAATVHYNRSQAAFDRAASQWAAVQARGQAEQQREIAVAAGAREDDANFFEARRAYQQASGHYRQADYALAAKAFLQSAASYRHAVGDVSYRVAEQARTRAQLLHEQAPREGTNAALGRARLLMSDADVALGQGNPLAASELFEQAAGEFQLAIEEGHATTAHSTTLRSREQALNDGVRPDNADFKAATLLFEQATELHASGRFRAAVERLGQARQAFVAVGQKTRSVTRAFVMGTTADEAQIAHELCLRYERDCVTDTYRVEASREIRLRPFVIDDHEVTNEEFAEFAHSQDYRTHAEVVGYSRRSFAQATVKAPGFSWRAPGGSSTSHLRFPNRPVVHMTQADASAYCAWAGGRLPSAEEWEYAARGDERRLFPWGNEWSEHVLRWAGDAAEGPMAVKSFPASSTPAGHHDLAGNVREWTSTTRDGAAILKGGSWIDRNPASFRAAAERVRAADESSIDYGFRCAWDLSSWP